MTQESPQATTLSNALPVEVAARRRNLLRNPAVNCLLQTLSQCKFTLRVGKLECRLINVFAMGSSGLPRSRDIDIDLVFVDGTAFQGPEPSQELSAELLKLSDEANAVSRRKFRDDSSAMLWPSSHVELVTWPVYVAQFEDPTLFHTQIPGDPLRCDGAGGIANAIHLNEMIQTGVTLWNAVDTDFAIEEARELNPIKDIETTEAPEYLAIATRDLARAYMLQDIDKRDYLIAKSILRFAYSFCVAGSGRRIDRYEDVPAAYREEVERQQAALACMPKVTPSGTAMLDAARNLIHRLKRHDRLLTESAHVRSRDRNFAKDETVSAFRLFDDVRRFVELTFLRSERSTEDLKRLAYYKHRTMPDLCAEIYRVDRNDGTPTTEFFVQELGLAESLTTELASVRQHVQKLGETLPSHKVACDLAFRCVDKWLLDLPDTALPLEVQTALGRIDTCLDSVGRFKKWHESLLVSLIEADRPVEAFRRVVNVYPEWQDSVAATDRDKYVNKDALNIHWSLDGVASKLSGQELIGVFHRVLFLAAGLREQEPRDGQIDPTPGLSADDAEYISHSLLSELEWTTDQYCSYLEQRKVASALQLIRTDPELKALMGRSLGSSNAMEYVLTARMKLAREFYERASRHVTDRAYTTAIDILTIAQDLSPNWGSAHLRRAVCNARVENLWDALRDAVKGAVCGSALLSIDQLLQCITSPDWENCLIGLLEQIDFDSEAATHEFVSQSVRDLAYLHSSLTRDGLFSYASDAERVPEFAYLDSPEVVELAMTPIEWGHQTTALVAKHSKNSDSAKEVLERSLPDYETVEGPHREAILDPRVTSFADFLCALALIVHGKTADRCGGGLRPVTKEALHSMASERHEAVESLRKDNPIGCLAVLVPMDKFGLVTPSDYINLAQSLLKLHLLDDASKVLDKLERLRPAYHKTHRIRATLAHMRGHLMEAQFHVQQALLISPDYFAGQMQLAQLRREDGDLEGWARGVIAASLCDDFRGDVHGDVITDLLDAGFPLQACQVALRGLMVGIGREIVLGQLGNCLAALGKSSPRSESTVRRIPWRPFLMRGYLEAALALQHAGEYEMARELLKEAMSIDESGEPCFLLGELYSEWPEHSVEMVAAYEAAVQASPENATYLSGLGYAYQETSRLKEAERHFRSAIRLEADSLVAITRLGNCLVLQGRLDEALEYHVRARKLAPELSISYRNLAATYGHLGQWPSVFNVAIDGLEVSEKDEQLRKIATEAALRAQISIAIYPILIPHLATAIRACCELGLAGTKKYPGIVYNAIGNLAWTLSQRDPSHLGQLEQFILLGFEAGLCYECLVRPGFQIEGIFSNWRIPEALLEKTYKQCSSEPQAKVRESLEELGNLASRRWSDSRVGRAAIVAGYSLFVAFRSV